MPGILVVNHSLKKVGAQYGLAVLVTPNISAYVRSILTDYGIEIIEVEGIENPADKYPFARFRYMYSKLYTFSLIQFEKVVYIDSDMLVCNNLDHLFQRPHLSAANIGQLLPQCEHWVQFNAGFMVIKPSQSLFDDLVSQIHLLPSKDLGDQGFLHSYFPDWPNNEELHLCHGYNMYIGFISAYSRLFGYEFRDDPVLESEKIFRVIHYWGPEKPWNSRENVFNKGAEAAFNLWYKAFSELSMSFPSHLEKHFSSEFPFLTLTLTNYNQLALS